MDATTIGQVVILGTTIGGFLGVAWKERRNRLWALEDRRLAAAERERDRADLIEQTKAEAAALLIRTEAIAKALRIEAEAVAEKLRIQAETIAQDVATTLLTNNKETTEKLEASIAEVGASAHKAYEEANHVNIKIEHLNKRLLVTESEDKVSTKTDQKLDQVIETADSIEDKVDRLHEKAQ